MKAKTKRHIAGTVAATGFFLALGAVGGIEHFGASLGEGITLAVLGLLAFWLGGCKAGWFR